MREDHATIQRQAQRASRIIEEFLELSREREKVLAPIDINGLVDRALQLIGEQMRRSGINLETRLDRSLPEISGDGVALERVLINLLTNAHDALPQGGNVTIATGLLGDEQQWQHLTVADNGPGIHPDNVGKVFDLLYTTKSSGSGLGLWLSRRIIQEHNGRIDVQSELGKGTTFTIRLPAGESSGF
jgi:signal transduction histidine kinase